MMDWVLVLWVFVNLALFTTLFVYAFGLQRRMQSSSIRFIAVALSLVAGTFLVSSIQRLGIHAARAGLISETWEDYFLTTFQIVLSLVGSVAGIYAITRLRSGIRRLEQGERMLGVLTDKLPLNIDPSSWNLTPRESEVLETIVSGETSDEQIAATLFISPATAATHVRNILRKARLTSRMDLMLVGARRVRDDGQPGDQIDSES
jgi:DNA-binding CsgD family transcriptional regulator